MYHGLAGHIIFANMDESLLQTAVLGTVFTSAAAYRLVQSGIILHYANEEERPFPLRVRVQLEAQGYEITLFAGGILLCLFWVRLHMCNQKQV